MPTLSELCIDLLFLFRLQVGVCVWGWVGGLCDYVRVECVSLYLVIW